MKFKLGIPTKVLMKIQSIHCQPSMTCNKISRNTAHGHTCCSVENKQGWITACKAGTAATRPLPASLVLQCGKHSEVQAAQASAQQTPATSIHKVPDSVDTVVESA
jgi:hypothetical protein